MTDERPTYFLDTESGSSHFLIGLKRESDGKERIFEQSERSTIDYALVRRILMSGTIVTYNGKNYDMPVLWYAIDGAETVDDEGHSTRRDRTCAEIKRASDRIIQGNLRWWQAPQALGVEIPRQMDHVDLIEVQPNPFASLKALNARMNGKWLQDLPYHHDAALNLDEIDKLREYLGNDLAATELLWRTLREPLDLRRAIGAQIGIDLRSMSDTQMGLAIIKQRCEKALGRPIKRNRSQTDNWFRYTPPSYIRFDTPVLRDMLDRIQQHDFIVQDNGKVELPDFLTKPFRLGESEFAMGIGGLHSTESNRAVRADYQHRLYDFDVRGYYPSIMMTLGLFPKEIGPLFIDVFRGIVDDRNKAKARQKALKKEIAALEAELTLLEASNGQ